MKEHVLDGEYVPRCDNCILKGNQCTEHSLAKKYLNPVDHCICYVSQFTDWGQPKHAG
jgi:hypothetical protein